MYSGVNDIYHVVDYLPSIYLSCNWKYLPFDCLHQFSFYFPPLVTTNLISFSMNLFLKYNWSATLCSFLLYKIVIWYFCTLQNGYQDKSSCRSLKMKYVSCPFLPSPSGTLIIQMLVWLVLPQKSLWRRQWHPTPVLLPGKSHGWRSLEGCSPWGCGGSDTTERLHFHFSLSCIGEGNGNPLHCSCLENPRDGGAWWAAVYGVAQSRTRLKRLSSSSSRSLLNCPHFLFKN